MRSSRELSAAATRGSVGLKGQNLRLMRGRFATPCRSTSTALPLPQTVNQMVEQAAFIVKQAQDKGCNRQVLELLNPVNEKGVNFLSTEAIDYPCSNMREFETIVGVAKAVLQQLVPGAELRTKRIDEGGLDGE